MTRALLLALLVPTMACSQDPSSKAQDGPTGAGDSAPATTADGADGADGVEDGADGGGEDSAPEPWSPDDDSDGDGLTDGEEGRSDDGSRDTDGDDTPDYLDDDSDNDGIPDAVEALPRDGAGDPVDTDGDGAPDYLDPDSDDDGLTDRYEAPDAPGDIADTDGDGVPDFRDLDADGDSLLDADEGIEDWDGDGIPNVIDPRNDGAAPAMPFTALSTAFNAPIGIDFHEPSSSVVLSVNYPSGSPYAFERVLADGSHVPFSGVSGLTNEVKIATARSGGMGGFTTGQLFVGNGNDGELVRISPDGSAVDNPWVSLAGSGNGLFRGSLYIDRTGVWGGDLLAATTAGELWRIDSAGAATLIVDVNDHLEGLVSVPDAPARYGPLAGRAIAGAENTGLLYAIAPDGSYETHDLGVAIEDIDILVPGENFFGVNYGTSKLIGVPALDLRPLAGDLLLTQESVTAVGLFRLNYDGTALQVEELQAASGSATLGQWEHVTTADAGIVEVPKD